MRRMLPFLATALLAGLPVWADSITADGKTYEDVYVVEGGSMYYIHSPVTGKVVGVRKDAVSPEQVRLTQDKAARQALRDRWSAANERLTGRSKQGEPGGPATPAAVALGLSAVGQAPAPAKPAVPRLYVPAPPTAQGEYVTDGTVHHVKLDNVPLGQALKGILRPMNLDYKVEDGYVWVSTPERIRTESFEPLQTGYYDLQSAGSETLPKVLVGNTGGVGGTAGLGTGTGGGFGGGGGLGGGIGGGGGVGGGMAGGGLATTGFSNISQLFSTIDDRLVGEPPAVIGSGTVLITGGNANYAAHNGLRSTRGTDTQY
jgi:hypothetical protein